LLESLKSPETFVRHRAKRVLKERGAARVMPDLRSWFNQLDASDPQVERHRLEALWTCQSLDVPEARLLEQVARSADHRVRSAAARVAGAWHDRVPQAFDILARGARDEHPRVRLEAVRGLAQVPTPDAVEAALAALEFPIDANLDFALWQTAR